MAWHGAAWQGWHLAWLVHGKALEAMTWRGMAWHGTACHATPATCMASLPPMLPTLATCRSRVAVLYTIFSLACALALLLLLAEIFNYPLGLKVGTS